jgi:hypothetical protein
VICSPSSRGGKEVGGGFNETERDNNLLKY